MSTQTFAIPSYERVAETLRDRVRAGSYLVGELIPPAVKLEKSFQVSNITIRKALGLLSEEGWIKSQRGKGTVVLSRPKSDVVDIRISGNFTDWLDSASARDHKIKQRVLGIDLLRCPPGIQQILDVNAGSDIWRMRWGRHPCR
jgi:DNA-binding GntR family transcriptional regulator